MPDGDRPDGARVSRIVVVVSEAADGARRVGDRVGVAKVGKRDGRGAHERAVASAAPRALVQLPGGLHGGGRVTAERAGRAQYRSGLHPDVGGGARPVDPRGDELVVRRGVAQVDPARGGPRDGHGHGGVVGPLPRSPAEAAAPDHADGSGVGQRRPELVAGAEGVSGGGADKRPDGAVGKGGGGARA